MSVGKPQAESLAQVRREIESVDRSIVLLLAARLEAAQRALEVRYALHHRVTDKAQELLVLERGRRWCREFGVPETLVDQLFRTLVEEGKARFRTSGKSAERPFVTVLLAAPEDASVALHGPRATQPVSVPTLR